MRCKGGWEMEGRGARGYLMNLKCRCHTRTHVPAQGLPQRDPKGSPASRITERWGRPSWLRAARAEPRRHLAQHLGLCCSLEPTFPRSFAIGTPHLTLLPGLLWPPSGDRLSAQGWPPALGAGNTSILVLAVLTADQMPHLEHSLGRLLPHLSCTLLLWLQMLGSPKTSCALTRRGSPTLARPCRVTWGSGCSFRWASTYRV